MTGLAENTNNYWREWKNDWKDWNKIMARKKLNNDWKDRNNDWKDWNGWNVDWNDWIIFEMTGVTEKISTMGDYKLGAHWEPARFIDNLYGRYA